MICLIGRSGGIRTHDPQSPRLMRYQAALRSEPWAEPVAAPHRAAKGTGANHPALAEHLAQFFQGAQGFAQQGAQTLGFRLRLGTEA